jgi:hypothetical protein
MFNFSANHLRLLPRMEYRTCVVFLMQDDFTTGSIVCTTSTALI